MSTPISLCRSACCFVPASAATRMPRSCASLTSFAGGGGRAPARSDGSGARARSRPASLDAATDRQAAAPGRLSAVGQLGDVVLRPSGESTNCGAPPGSCSTSLVASTRRLGCRRISAGISTSTPYGLSPISLLDPVQLDLELLGGEGDGAEHAEPAGLGHRGDTSRQWLKARMGNSTPSMSQISVRIELLLFRDPARQDLVSFELLDLVVVHLEHSRKISRLCSPRYAGSPVRADSSLRRTATASSGR